MNASWIWDILKHKIAIAFGCAVICSAPGSGNPPYEPACMGNYTSKRPLQTTPKNLNWPFVLYFTRQNGSIVMWTFHFTMLIFAHEPVFCGTKGTNRNVGVVLKRN